jgi:hypothetical protein
VKLGKEDLHFMGKSWCWGLMTGDRKGFNGDSYYHSTVFLLNTADAITVLPIVSRGKPLIYNMYSHANIKS